jgi:hypothetical protein
LGLLDKVLEKKREREKGEKERERERKEKKREKGEKEIPPATGLEKQLNKN